MISGSANLDEVFCNEEATIQGGVNFNYLGTTKNSITKTAVARIKKIETNMKYKYIPTPDWGLLNKKTTVKDQKEITSAYLIGSYKYENNLTVKKMKEMSGILVVDGDLVIDSCANVRDIAIFCTGNVTIKASSNITGLIYAGKNFNLEGNVNIGGAILVNGLAKITGNINGNIKQNRKLILNKYSNLFRK